MHRLANFCRNRNPQTTLYVFSLAFARGLIGASYVSRPYGISMMMTLFPIPSMKR